MAVQTMAEETMANPTKMKLLLVRNLLVPQMSQFIAVDGVALCVKE